MVYDPCQVAFCMRMEPKQTGCRVNDLLISGISCMSFIIQECTLWTQQAWGPPSVMSRGQNPHQQPRKLHCRRVGTGNFEVTSHHHRPWFVDLGILIPYSPPWDELEWWICRGSLSSAKSALRGHNRLEVLQGWCPRFRVPIRSPGKAQVVAF